MPRDGFEWTGDLVEQFISKFRENESVWNTKCKDNKIAAKKQLAWKTIRLATVTTRWQQLLKYCQRLLFAWQQLQRDGNSYSSTANSDSAWQQLQRDGNSYSSSAKSYSPLGNSYNGMATVTQVLPTVTLCLATVTTGWQQLLE